MVSLSYLLRFIEEDAPRGDITSDVIIPDVGCTAVIRSERDGTVAGLAEVQLLFTHFGVTTVLKKTDGDSTVAGEVLVKLDGPAKKVLLVERTALNIIGRMSGIASETRTLSDRIRAINQSCRLAATRKTCPGFGMLDKKAVLIGGGDPHRASLSEGFLIKDNHLALVPLREAIGKARAYSAYKKVEVEVETPADARAAAEAGADIVMLDNMNPQQVRETIALLKTAGLRDRVTIEVSGGISGTSIDQFAASGADIISMGSLTHTVRNFPVTLEISPDSIRS